VTASNIRQAGHQHEDASAVKQACRIPARTMPPSARKPRRKYAPPSWICGSRSGSRRGNARLNVAYLLREQFEQL
jgi:hypothetical protein